MRPTVRCRGLRIICTASFLCALPAVIAGCGDGDSGSSGSTPSGMAVRQTNLVSDVTGAATTDPNLVNAWGIARGPTTAFWVADNHAGVSTLYNGAGHPFPAAQPLVVTVPPPAGSDPGTMSSPTGVVFNDTSDFVITDGSTSGASAFIFSTEDGTISGWNLNVSAGAAILTADNSAAGAIYKGLALASTAAGNFLYATNFHQGRVDVFDKAFAPASLAGTFADASIPAGFAPFGIANVGGNLYVTYAKQDENQEDDVKAPGNGYVDIFNANGILMRRFASQGALNSPWGVVVAPAGFGSLGNGILIGNFGDGRINAFNASGQFLGALMNGQSPLSIDGLWGLSFGNGTNAGDANTLFFTAGPSDEAHGLFGSLQAAATGM